MRGLGNERATGAIHFGSYKHRKELGNDGDCSDKLGERMGGNKGVRDVTGCHLPNSSNI